MRLVVVDADRVVDMAAPRGRETDLSWPLGRARFLEMGEPVRRARQAAGAAWASADVDGAQNRGRAAGRPGGEGARQKTSLLMSQNL